MPFQGMNAGSNPAGVAFFSQRFRAVAAAVASAVANFLFGTAIARALIERGQARERVVSEREALAAVQVAMALEWLRAE